ncbi:hypothetical protein HYDPIDRAFT_93903 [Hydnomerulius pinastri MD-312]|uniref:Uncharacterized protein n=1 Tax=Hydnomerulius pinastri MD-312 TaxID=994086 RepID=A0A0C9WDP2_9AGAM|nr:hypothetical protein HYDPIDRAFT_93903 [Hydnomerulius pinastri MD-312]
MAEVKRSLSAVEARDGPKREATSTNYASSSLGGPGTITPKRTPASQSLHPFSALTPPPSRALFPGPATPATNRSTSTAMDDLPSTPTPASRHLSDKSKGKRKAEDIDLTPPEQKKEGQRATFVLPSESRSQRISNSSHAPSSYHRKRARLSSTSPFATPVHSRPASAQDLPPTGTPSNNFASWSSNTSARVAPPPRTPSRAASTRSQQPQNSNRKNHERHQSMSQVSIPISALVSPHAPSVSRSTKFHMRDPRRPPKKLNDTEWGLRFATEDEPGSPSQAWCFYVGFILFPIWWFAALFLRIPKTRMVGDASVEKAVTIDDPQIEHDAKSWRFRCRVVAVISVFTYIPFIVLIAIFVPR